MDRSVDSRCSRGRGGARGHRGEERLGERGEEKQSQSSLEEVGKGKRPQIRRFGSRMHAASGVRMSFVQATLTVLGSSSAAVAPESYFLSKGQACASSGCARPGE